MLVTNEGRPRTSGAVAIGMPKLMQLLEGDRRALAQMSHAERICAVPARSQDEVNDHRMLHPATADCY
jgi:hypothetical protein